MWKHLQKFLTLPRSFDAFSDEAGMLNIFAKYRYE